jgi:hypothetical protein
MQHSRIFLGATPAILVIAGVAAAKMSHFSATTTKYYCTHISADSARICLPYTLDNCQCDIGGTITCYFTVQGGTLPNYTLYTNGTIGQKKRCGSTGNCTAKCLYTVFE